MSRILVIEDEQDMQFMLCDNLRAEGHEVEAVGTGREGLGKGLSGEYALIVLDIMLPDINGIEVCKKIRARDPLIPVVMLTAKGDEVDKVVGLEVGADDYITKPFSMREFVARVKAALRRGERAPGGAVAECAIGDARVDFARRELSRGRERISLTRCENDLLRLLATQRGETVSRRRILEAVWGSELQAGNRTVDNYVARLRGKIEPNPAQPQHILTDHGAGYRLV
jgi:DNA-binding response OmpR family regulator